MRTVDTRLMRATLLACVGIACGAAGAAGAADPPAAAALELSALTGPKGADLYIEAPEGTSAFEHVHVQIRAPEGSDEQANRIINLKDVAATDGVARIDLGKPGRGATVSAEAHVRGAERGPHGDPPRRDDRHACGRISSSRRSTHRRRPSATRPVDVVADVSELNQATSVRRRRFTLMLGPTPPRRAEDGDGAERAAVSRRPSKT